MSAEGLRVRVLGRVRAWTGDHEIDLGPGRRRALFAVLAAHAGRAVGRDELILALWGHSPPSTAAGNIYTYVSALRHSLAPLREPRSPGGPLTSGPAGYRLRLAPGALDSDRFTALPDAATDLAGAGRPGDAVARLDEALALWHGDAYANLTGHFVELDRHRLDELRIGAAEDRARLILAGRGHDDLVAELTALVRDHPLHEPFHELLIQALHRAGRDAAAREAYHAARRVLADELGVEPGPAIRALGNRIRGGPVVPAPRRARPSYTGRTAEVSLLRDLAAAAAAGRGATVWIEGEPGIGKSALLAEALRDAGGRIAWGVADEFSRRIPLDVLATALDPDRAAVPRDDPAAAVEGILDHVGRLCAAGPLLLVLDDLQWADEASLLVFERLVAATRRLPLLLVAAARSEPNGRALTRLRRGVETRGGHVVVLGPLPAADIEEIFGTAAAAPPGATLRSLAGLTAGNPLYARELVAGLIRQHDIRVVDGLAEVRARPTGLPEALLDAVGSTLDHLSGATRETLRYAALLGAEFAVADVAAFTGRAPADLIGAFEEAAAANVVVDAGSRLAFRDPVLRQALTESVPATLRVALHRHAAEVLAAAGAAAVLVAEQLVAGTPEADAWLVDWLVGHRDELIGQAPGLAGELIRRALAGNRCTPAQREALHIALFTLGTRTG